MMSHDQMNDESNHIESIAQEAEQKKDAYDIPEDVNDTPCQSFPSDKEDTDPVNGQEALILTMKPHDLPSGYISIRDLTQIAGGLQDLTDSIANTIYNQPSEKGKIPEDLLDDTEMILSDIQAESFQAVLTIRHPKQTSLEKPDVIATLQELFQLFESSNHDDDNHLAEIVSLLGPRTLRVYADWTKAMAESGTPIHIEWHSAYHDTTFAAFDSEKADRIYQALATFSNTNDDISVKGTFTGANIRTGTFELITEEGERLSGTISKDAMADFSTIKFNQTYTVELLKISVTGSAINDKIAWTLKNITPA